MVKQSNCVTRGVPERAEGMMSTHRFLKHYYIVMLISAPINPISPNSGFCKMRVIICVLPTSLAVMRI